MIFLLDTNALSDLMGQNEKATARLDNIHATDRVIICPIVLGEIRYGIGRLPSGKKRTELEVRAAQMFSLIPCESLTETMSEHYAALKITLEQKGIALSENDIWIAATAMELSAVLVTRDRDFRQVDGLTVEDWTA
jgi:Predicted nucleic acid-binding protein, contains PIN domain